MQFAGCEEVAQVLRSTLDDNPQISPTNLGFRRRWRGSTRGGRRRLRHHQHLVRLSVYFKFHFIFVQRHLDRRIHRDHLFVRLFFLAHVVFGRCPCACTYSWHINSIVCFLPLASDPQATEFSETIVPCITLSFAAAVMVRPPTPPAEEMSASFRLLIAAHARDRISGCAHLPRHLPSTLAREN